MRHLLKVILVLGVFASGVAVSAVPAPNILAITVDDMSADSVGVFGASVRDVTPNIDRLASEGLRFERAHVQVANCMPSRNVMWSGRYPQSNGIEGFYPNAEAAYPTLGELLHKAGYFTAIRHKLKDSTPYRPYPWGTVLDQVASGKKLPIKDPASYGHSITRGIEAAKSAGKPFYILVNIADPHVPFFGMNRLGEVVRDPYAPSRIFLPQEVTVPVSLPDDPIVRAELAHYYSSVRRADDAVGHILRALQESGAADNTIVLFLSDHGMPFPFVKTQLYHKSTHTPLVWRWPGVTRPGAIDNAHMVSAVDLMPTLLEAIGEPVPDGVEGRSFLPLLKGGKQGSRSYVFKAYGENSAGQRTPMRAAQSERFLYIFNPWSDGKRRMYSATMGTGTFGRMEELAGSDEPLARRLDFLRHRTVEEFYDIEKDPDCLNNLIDDPRVSEALGQHRDELGAWLLQIGDPLHSVYQDRNQPLILAAFMQSEEQAARERREWRKAIGEAIRQSANDQTKLQ